MFAGDDTFRLGQSDQSVADGGHGADVFIMGASLRANDAINGGAGADTMRLAGDYSGGLTLGADTMSNIETLIFSKGSSYAIAAGDYAVGGTHTLTIDASQLARTDALSFDAFEEHSGRFAVTGGKGEDSVRTGRGADDINGGGGRDALEGGRGDDVVNGAEGRDTLKGDQGNDQVAGGDGNDRVFSGKGDDNLAGGDGNDHFFVRSYFGTADHIDGGVGIDTVHLAGGDVVDTTLSSLMIESVETVALGRGSRYTIHFDDTDPVGDHITIDGAALGASDVMNVDASNAAVGATVLAGDAADTVRGSDAADVISGGLGVDELAGGLGADTFLFNSVLESTGAGADTITDFDAATDVIDVAQSVTNIDTPITGLLSSLDGLTGLLGLGNLAAGDAVMVQPLLGLLAGSNILVVDQNGIGGYQAGQDLVVLLEDGANLGSLGLDNFI
jgi:Ca2+-binding RTX toxin-like protein